MLSDKAALNKDRAFGRRYAGPIMQHRHFAYIAKIIREDGDKGMALVFADRLGETNPNFDRARFLAAAGY